MRSFTLAGRAALMSALAAGALLAVAAPSVQAGAAPLASAAVRAGAAPLASAGPAVETSWSGGGPSVTAGPAVRVSRGAACRGQNAEVESAIDPATQTIYEAWIGCGGIGFARSTDGGRTFSAGFRLPGSGFGWDPAITIGPRGSVYAAFMISRGSGTNQRSYPVVDISTDNGQTFPTVSPLIPPRKDNWGDRDFIAVGPRGAIYVTWDYGPHNLTPADFVCTPSGSCSFVAGDLNAVIQRSTNGGKTWSKITPISPGFPASGADSAPIFVEPSGRLDVLYQGYQVLNRRTLKLGVAHSYFTASADFGKKWSRPVRIGPRRLSMGTGEWWIDGSLGIDAAGNLYATWDTQSGGRDVGWLAFSTDHGRRWSRLVRVTPDKGRAVHIVQVVGGAARRAYVGWLTDSPRRGYAQFLRAFAIGRGWTSPIVRVSPSFGNRHVWPGDTIGMSLFPGGASGAVRLAVSWGSALGGRGANAEIWASVVSDLP
jgi:BNR/Asp-box repeat